MAMQNHRKLNSDTKAVVRFLESVLELAALTILYYGFWRIGYEAEPFPAYQGNGKYLLMGIYALLCWIFIKNSEGFQFGNLRRLDLGIAQWSALSIVNVVTYFWLCLIANRIIRPLPMLLLLAADVFVSTSFIFLYNALYRILYAPHHMLMIYGSDKALSMKLKLDTRRERYNVCRMLPADMEPSELYREIDQAESVILNDIPAQLRNDILKYCYKNQIRTYVIPKITDILLRGATNITAVDTPMLLVKGIGLTIGQRFLKRMLDIALSLTAAVITFPVMLIIAAAIRLEDGGPVFYRQRRATRGGKEFDILKFRSMIVDAEKDGRPIPATGEDPRITKTGRIIRSTRLDELPQIFNILKGDMSIVGPRPERLEHIEKYSETIPEFAYRLKVKGGLTGYAQIYGKYNTDAYDKLRLDLTYIEDYSFLLDIKLILLTIRVLFSKSSTEGFDVAKADEKRREILSRQLREEQQNILGK